VLVEETKRKETDPAMNQEEHSGEKKNFGKDTFLKEEDNFSNTFFF